MRILKLKMLLLLFSISLTSEAQYYMFGGYNYAAIGLKGTDNIVQRFNIAENHNVPSMSYAFHGYQLGFGRFSEHTMMEIGFGNLISNQSSLNTNQLKERAEIVVNYMSAHFRAAYKPFAKIYFNVGAALKLCNFRYRYSFGGDYQTPVEHYQVGLEIFADYALKLKFLLKKSQRKDYYYLLRIQPYYQFLRKVGIGPMETQLNQTPNVTDNSIEDNFSHFGFNISLIIPFISEEDRLFLEAKPKSRKKKNSKKTKEKAEPKRRL